ncbi:MAG: riboflavin synthase [Pirellulales bacterium]|nr:riboflavin synthase [Pirellulales bacterium]
MFTGIIETRARVVDVVEEPPGVRLVIEAPAIAVEAKLGESIALNGCCLTVVSIAGSKLSFQAGPETLVRTNLGKLTVDACVNLEQSLKVGDRLGGHFVTGHVDGLGSLASREDDGEWSTFWFNVPEELARHMVAKGSVAIDGVSLTLVEVTENRFSVALIPHTLDVTTLGELAPGDPVNLETDLLAKFVQKQMG